jgi:hypothetical protein
MAVPMDADVIGYIVVRLLSRRAACSFRDIPPGDVTDIGPPDFQVRMKANFYMCGTLVLENEERLRLTAAQARPMIPFIRGIGEANFDWHMAKEQVGDALTARQRTWILQRIGKLGDGTLANQGEITRMFRDKGNGQ